MDFKEWTSAAISGVAIVASFVALWLGWYRAFGAESRGRLFSMLTIWNSDQLLRNRALAFDTLKEKEQRIYLGEYPRDDQSSARSAINTVVRFLFDLANLLE